MKVFWTIPPYKTFPVHLGMMVAEHGQREVQGYEVQGLMISPNQFYVPINQF